MIMPLTLIVDVAGFSNVMTCEQTLFITEYDFTLTYALASMRSLRLCQKTTLIPNESKRY